MKIGFVLTDNMLMTSTTWPSEMWMAAQSMAALKRSQSPHITLATVSSQQRVIECHTNMRLCPENIISDEIQYDLIYLPALWRNPRPVIKQEAALINWLQQQYEDGATLCAVGTGCCFIAATGLLDYKPATTHWYYFDQFNIDYPKVQLKRQHFITEAGRLYCAASINSLADLTVHFIHRHYGQVISQQVERHFSHEIRQSYGSINYAEKQNDNHPDETILQAQMWLQDHFSEELKLDNIAQRHGMSERNFSRRFKQAVGQTPSQFIQELRINSARDLLHYSNLNINEIADRVGFSDMSYFAKTFRKHLSVSPRDYRATVRAKLFNKAQQ